MAQEGLVNSDEMRRGITPGMIAGYLFFAYAHHDAQGVPISFGWYVLASMVIGAIYTGVFVQ